jgi:hypothetical protein
MVDRDYSTVYFETLKHKCINSSGRGCPKAMLIVSTSTTHMGVKCHAFSSVEDGRWGTMYL